MSHPDPRHRELPSVNEDRLRKSRLLNWLFLLISFAVIVLAALWIGSGVKSLLHKDERDRTTSAEPLPASPDKLFTLPALPVPPKPEARVPVHASLPGVVPVPVSASMPTVPKAKPEPATG